MNFPRASAPSEAPPALRKSRRVRFKSVIRSLSKLETVPERGHQGVPSSFAQISDLFLSMKPTAVDQVEQEQADQTEQEHNQVRIQIPKIRYNNAAVIRQRGNLREYLGVGQAIKYGSGQKAEKTRDYIIEFSFTATGGACARSITTQSHANSEHQSTDNVSKHIGRWNVREFDHSYLPQHV